MQNERQKKENTTQPTWIPILTVLIIHAHNFVCVCNSMCVLIKNKSMY